MLKKIRVFYWKKRDQGKGRKTLLEAGGIMLCFISLIILGVVHNLSGQKAPEINDAVSGSAVSGGAVTGSSVTGSAVTGGAVSPAMVGKNPEGTPQNGRNNFSVDTGGLAPFLGFMSDESYEQMVSLLTKECEEKEATFVKKLEYQRTDGFWVTSYVLISDGSICRVTYNLKADQVNIAVTSFTETDVTSMKRAAEQKEKKKLAKERKAGKKKRSKSKKKKTKKDVG